MALVRAHSWLVMLESGVGESPTEAAESEGMDRADVSRMVNLATFALDVVVAFLDEAQALEVTMLDLASGTPLLWDG